MSDQAEKNPADTDDTMQAPPSEEPETIASDTTTVDRDELACSLDETDEIQSTRHGRIVSAGLIALVAGIVAAVIWFAAVLLGHASSKPPNPPAVSTTVTKSPVAAPPPPITLTVMPPPPPPVPTTPLASASAASYLAALQVLGIHWWEGDGGSEKAVATGLRAGRSQEAIINGLVWGDGSIAWKPNEVPIITEDARKIVGAATVHLCPDAP
jgi:hypothetical protein